MKQLLLAGDPEGKKRQDVYWRAMGGQSNNERSKNANSMDVDVDRSWEMLDNQATDGLGEPMNETSPSGPNIPFSSRSHSFSYPNSHKQFYPGAAKTYGRGENLMDRFEADQFAEARKENLYYPFSNHDEWSMALFLLTSSLTMKEIDEFLRLPLVKMMNLSFHTAIELRGRAELLPSGPKWQLQILDVAPYTTKDPVRLFYRDPLEVVEFLFSNPLIQGYIDLVPMQEWTTQEKVVRLFREWMSADASWDMQSRLPAGATLLGIILSSDKMNISVLTGDRVAHPLLLGLANIDMALLGKDTPEASLIACVSGKTSHVTLASHKTFGDSDRQETRSGSTTLAQINEVASRINPNNVEAFTKAAKKKYRLNGVDQPYWRDWPLSRDPERFLTPEPLHHWHKFFFDHDLKWVGRIIGNEEMDFRFSLLQPKIGFRHFKAGVSKLKQCTGREHREMQRHIVCIIADAAAPEIVVCIRALNDFRYLGQGRVFPETVISQMTDSLGEFHSHKEQLADAGARPSKSGNPNWYIPKLEFMHSVMLSIRASGAPMQFSADPTEKAHSTLIKQPAREHTNNRDYDPQIIRHLDRDERLRLFNLSTSIKSSGIDLRALLTFGQDEDDETQRIDLDPIASQARVPRDLFQEGINGGSAMTATPTPHQIFVTPCTAFCLNRLPDTRSISIEDASALFKLPDLGPALGDYFSGRRTFVLGGRHYASSDNLSLPFSNIRVWYSFQVQNRPLEDGLTDPRPARTLQVHPPSAEWPNGRYDCAIFGHEWDSPWPCQINPAGKDLVLGYFHSLELFIHRSNCWANSAAFPANNFELEIRSKAPSIEKSISSPLGPGAPRGHNPSAITGMYALQRAIRASDDRIGGIIPLGLLRMPVDVVPWFGAKADSRLTSDNSMESSKEFWLNKYWDKEYYSLF
ncbi:hypothetical protein C8J56DRAFT_894479 [Mycena floridula]|nr:hypothetical protein C8J56DRAFT_894479 [Mycena floridula]